jgi:PAS domain S-box-containing protein
MAGETTTEPSFLRAGGDAAALLRSHDWSGSPLGPPATWPAALETMVGACLAAATPMLVWWGPELAALCNDAALPLAGGRRPPPGLPGRQSWASLWHHIGPQIEGVLAAGAAAWSPDVPSGGAPQRGDRTARFTWAHSAIRNPDGSIGGVLSLVIDGTALASTPAEPPEESLCRAIAELRALLDTAPIGLWITQDSEGTDARGNRLAAAWMGVRPEANLSLSGPPAERPRVRVLRGGVEQDPADLPLRRAARGTEVWNEVLEVHKEDGTVQQLLCSAVPVRGADGRITRAISTATDITPQLAAERQLRELTAELEQRVAEALAQRKTFADIVERTDAFVQVADRDYRWLAINEASADEFERIYGVRPKPGDSMLDILAGQPKHQAEVRAVWSRALAGEEFTQIAAFGDPDRRRRHYEMKFNLLRDAEGQPIGAYQFVTDVTQRVQDQERLAEAQAQLHEMRKLETIGQLTGGIAHDFNNLLTPILGALDQLAGQHNRDAHYARLLGGAVQCAERARLLVGRLLSFARRQHLETRPVAVPELVRGMAELIERSLGPLIEVTLDLPPALPAARADPNQLELALLNLCVNARDAMPGGGRLRIVADAIEVGEASVSPPPGRHVRLAVIDSGTGMDAETLRRAVEPFYTTKGVGKGTGLGLSMVHGLAAQLGGALVLDSAPGRGTTATIYLPVAGSAAPADPAVEPPPPPPTGPLTILLVDDEELVRTAMAGMLRALGHRVVEAESCAAALGQLQAGPEIDLLIADYLMPSMSGAGLATAARRLVPGLPAFLVTGYGSLDAAEAAGLPQLAKPFRQRDLAAMIAATAGHATTIVPLRRQARRD